MTTAAATKVTGRACGDCQLCCKLLPVRELSKRAGVRCEHQKFHAGCRIYARRPPSCALWSCRWLTGDDTSAMRRPDHAHYCIDCLPDFITITYSDGSLKKMPVVQIWVDPKHKDAHRDPDLRAYLIRRAHEGVAALVRYDANDGFCLFAPPVASDGQWHEVKSAMREAEHSAAEIYAVIQWPGTPQAAPQYGEGARGENSLAELIAAR